MNRRSNFNIFAIVLCVLALFVAQTFGDKAVYYCLCDGGRVPTQTSHCFGPHGEQCAENEAQGRVSTNDEGDGDRRDHQVVDQEVQLRPVGAAEQVIAPRVQFAILPMVEILFASRESEVPASGSVDSEESPPFGVTVARTIVLLI